MVKSIKDKNIRKVYMLGLYLIGDDGESGPKGEKGMKGDAGIDGTPGIQGDKGTVGTNGRVGPPGAKGRQVRLTTAPKKQKRDTFC